MTDRLIRITTALAVVAVAGVAAIISYQHAYELVSSHGETGATAHLLPFTMDGIQLEVVGVDDAARAMLLAAERGRTGERDLISEKMIPLKDVVRIAADEAGVPPPQRSISVPMLYAMAALGTLKARLTGKRSDGFFCCSLFLVLCSWFLVLGSLWVPGLVVSLAPHIASNK